jgi:myo-inositol-1(or 4)-monophosphatase
VSATDIAVESMIHSSITERYPDHAFFGEEKYAKDKQMSIGDGFTWIVDPIDVSDNLNIVLDKYDCTITLMMQGTMK